MYLQFFGFREAPFNLTPDSKFLFLSHRHQEALAALLFGVQERKGFICLTGEIGCGKTTLCRAMLSQLDQQRVRVCVVLNSYLTDVELLKTINEGYGLPSESDSKKELLDRLNEYLVAEFSHGHNVVLIIDEAQNLRPDTLEQIRMISNLETETAKLIQIVLVGQPELRRTLSLPELEQLNQRITVRYHIMPLAENEVPDYIRHRMAVAEPQVEITFTDQAFRLVHHYSRGVPRRINVIVDRCLLVAYVQGTFTIDDKVVQQAVEEVRGESGGPAAGGDPLLGGGLPSRRTVPGWALVSLLALAAITVIVGSIFLGQLLVQKTISNQFAQATATPYATPSPVLTSVPTPRAFPIGEEVPLDVRADVLPPEEVTTPTPSPTPSPTPTPTPTPFLYQDWTRDADGVLRVQDSRLVEAAAYISLLRLWDIEIDLTPFRQSDPEEVAQFDMLAMVRQEPLNFEADRTEELSEALRLNMPVLVHLQESSDMAPYGVIQSMQGDILEYIDPVYGERVLRRAELAPLVRQTVVLFPDEDQLTGLGPGSTGEQVEKLQLRLRELGFFQGNPDGKYGQQTREAVQGLQSDGGLEPTGEIDRPTAAALYARRNPQHPRLY